MKVYEALADVFVAEQAKTVFGLMGDGNMFWMAAMAERPGVRMVHARYEGAAVAMADGYYRATGDVGVCSVTCGPGLTQIGTSLAASVKHRTSMVVFAGDTPLNAAFHLQQFEQKPFVVSTGAIFLPVHRIDRIAEDVQLAFYRARTERLPVVLSVPYDLQDLEYEWDLDVRPPALPLATRPAVPDPTVIARAAEMLGAAQRPVILAGRGAVAAGARAAILALADKVGALLVTSLRAKGWFDGEPFDGGVCGAFATSQTRALLAEADCVVGVGARLGYFTTEAGYMFPNASIIKIDVDPVGYIDGQRTADVVIRGDADQAVRALSDAVSAGGTGYRTDDVAAALSNFTPDEPTYELQPGTLDPRDVIREVDTSAPKDWRIVVGAGHFWNFAVAGLSGRSPDSYVFTYDFGVIGQGLPTAMGIAVADPNRPVLLIEGDGSIVMNVQELESLGRHRIPVLVVVMNDGAYGAEVHKLRSKGVSGDEAIFGMPDLAAVAQAFGVRGVTANAAGDIKAAVDAFLAEPGPMVVDARVSPNVLSRQYRRLFFGKDS